MSKCRDLAILVVTTDRQQKNRLLYPLWGRGVHVNIKPRPSPQREAVGSRLTVKMDHLGYSLNWLLQHMHCSVDCAVINAIIQL